MAPSTSSTLERAPERVDTLIDALRLIRTPHVGPTTYFHLIRRFGSATNALARLPELTQRSGKKLVPCSVQEAEAEIEATEKFGARLLVHGAADYPPLLAAIPDPPPVLAVLGDITLARKSCVAMVGARNASAAGCSIAARLARELGAAGITIVSGLARGIDTHAHRAALAAGTIAAIAGGIDNIYPPENEKLYAELREKGAIVSEQPFAGAPFAGSFPGRNRIIAGLSRATLVVEASLKSGSLITARFANEQGREVLAVPGSPLDPRSSGGNTLIKQGAQLVESAADVLEALSAPGWFRLEEPPELPFETFMEPDEATLNKAREDVLSKLGPTAVSMDELLAQCELPGGVVFTVLLELELAGRISRLPGGKVARLYP